jgi:AcrR family transcriptional regulator
MPKPRSPERRSAILSAGARVIAAHGLGAAATAAIAKEAGVSNGSLFVYFETKAALINELFVALKTEMGEAALEGLPDQRADEDSDRDGDRTRDQLARMWAQWMRWALSHPIERRALAQLEVAEEITNESRKAVDVAFDRLAQLLERCCSGGPMAETPLRFVVTLASAIAEATVDAVVEEPDQAEARSATAFDALWRVLAGAPGDLHEHLSPPAPPPGAEPA